VETPCVEAADDSFHAESPIPTCSELRKKGPVLFLPTMEHLTDEEFQNVPKYLIMTFFLCRYYYLTPATAGKTLFLVIFCLVPNTVLLASLSESSCCETFSSGITPLYEGCKINAFVRR